MFALERLVPLGPERDPQRAWARLAVCGNGDLLKKIKDRQQRPEDWRVSVLSAEYTLFGRRPQALQTTTHKEEQT